MRGQISVEALMVTGAIMAFVSLCLAFASSMGEDGSDISSRASSESRCSSLAAVIDAVSSAGPGAAARLTIDGNYTVMPGLVVGDGVYCMAHAAVNGSRPLSAGRLRIINRGGSVDFE